MSCSGRPFRRLRPEPDITAQSLNTLRTAMAVTHNPPVEADREDATAGAKGDPRADVVSRQYSRWRYPRRTFWRLDFVAMALNGAAGRQAG
jgi:hypothetical protein